jgi:hypothetical protein
MPQSTANKNYRTAVAGLITEASPLTFPENSSSSEDNCILFMKGNRTRRLGFKSEESYKLDAEVTLDQLQAGLEVSEYTWEAVNESGERDIVVVQVGQYLHFYDANTDSWSDNKYPFVVDLQVFAVAGVTDIENSRVSMTSGKGFLFVVGESIDPFFIEYDPDLNEIVTDKIYIRIRDFLGVEDGLANDEEPAILSSEHLYNLRNQGWLSPNQESSTTTVTGYTWHGFPVDTDAATSSPINQYFAQFSRYPGNNKQWWVGRLEVDNPEKGLEAGDFDPDLLNQTFFGNTRAPRGHYIVEAFTLDRTAVSGAPDIPVSAEIRRPTGTAFYAGRTWFSSKSDIYFSQVLETHRQAGACYQEADPTSEAVSDLVDSDGGYLPIPEAHNILRLYALGGGLVVFAENGLWFVSGGSGGFTANDLSITKISSNGLLGLDTLVEADGTIYWWSPVGIMSMSQAAGLFGAQDGAFDRVNISEQSIQSFYNNVIPDQAKKEAKGIYDPTQHLVQWLFRTVDGNPKMFYDRVINFNTTLKAFYPWTVSTTGLGPYICGAVKRTNVKSIRTKGYTTSEGGDTFSTLVKFNFLTQATPTTYKMSFGDFSNTEYSDWPLLSGTGLGYAYTSFAETGYEILEDLMRDKQQNYVYLYFRRTEKNIDTDGLADAPSSCLFQAKWDWSNSSISNRWSRKIQVYRRAGGRKEPSTTPGDAYEDGFEVVVSRQKVRGHGKAIQLRFESSEIGSNFDLLGWATHYTGETVV